MGNRLSIGMIGLDTSHAEAFTELLNNPDHPWHVPGGGVTVAYPGGSPDFELSASRVDRYTAKLRDEFGVRIADSIEEVAEQSDAVLLESVDGRVHPEQFARIAPYGKPVFIDKPFALSSAEAAEIIRLAETHKVPLMSCSALRYAEGLTMELDGASGEAVEGMDCFGPTDRQPTQPGLFWYGIHAAEMLFAGMGAGCEQVTAYFREDHDLVIGIWRDGRIGTLRGSRTGNRRFGAVVHRNGGSRFVDVYAHEKPYYASLLERVMEMFRTGRPAIDLRETAEIIRFLEAANESARTGETVRLWQDASFQDASYAEKRTDQS